MTQEELRDIARDEIMDYLTALAFEVRTKSEGNILYGYFADQILSLFPKPDLFDEVIKVERKSFDAFEEFWDKVYDTAQGKSVRISITEIKEA